MGLADGDLFVSESILSYQQANRIYQNFRGATVPTALQAGALWSDSDDDKLYHKGASLFEVHTGATSMYKWLKGGDKGSATALDISAVDGNYFDVTGAVTITSITTSGRIGTIICLHFDAALTFTHHATNLVLPGGANITTAAGDEAIMIEYDTGKWRCLSYSRADGTAVAGRAASGANSDITSMSGISGTILTPTNLANKTTGAWSKSIGSGGDYADWATMIAAMPDLIAHAVTVTIVKGTTLTELCELKNKHAVATAGSIIIKSQKFVPDPAGGAVPTADSATATTLRDISVFDTNDEYNDCWVLIVDGTGTDNGYVQITDTLAASGDIVVVAWPGAQPDGTSKYIIVGALIDGGGVREACMEVFNNTSVVTIDGIGLKGMTENGIRIRYNPNHLFFRSSGVYDCPFGGITMIACLRVDLHGNGIVKCNTNNHAAHGGIVARSTNIVEITNSGISDNLQRGIYGTDGCFILASGNSGDGNGAWGTYVANSSQAKFSGTECSGSGGNHSDPGTADSQNADQASAY